MLKLYVWDQFAPDYTDGLAFAIAASEELARMIIIKNVGHCPLDWGPVRIFDLTESVGFGVYGGG